MSQRSHMAKSGSRAMRACSTAWMAPGRLAQVVVRREQLRRQGEPHGFGDELLLGQVELLGAQHLVAAQPLLLEGDHPRCSPRSRPGGATRGPMARLQDLAEDAGVGLAPRDGVVGVPEGPDQGHAILDVESRHQVGVAHVQVDGARVQGREGGLGPLGADDVAGLLLDDGVLASGGASAARSWPPGSRCRWRTRRPALCRRKPSSARPLERGSSSLAEERAVVVERAGPRRRRPPGGGSG